MAEDADWFGNIFNSWLMGVIGGFFGFIGWWMVLFGDPTFFYTNTVGLDLMAPGVTSYALVFDS